MKRLLLWLLVILMLGVVAALYLVPWNRVLENRLTAFLQSQGMTDVTFTIDKVSFHEATLNNVAVGVDDPLRLQSVTVQYSPGELIEGRIRDLMLSGLDVQVVETEEGWKVAGVDGFPAPNDAEAGSPKMTLSDLADMLPFAKISVMDSFLRINGKSFQTSLPFDLDFTKGDSPTLAVTIDATSLTSGERSVSLGLIKAVAARGEGRNWTGTWTLESLDLGEAAPLPVMAGGGMLSYDTALTMDGTLSSADKTHTASFNLLYDPDNTAKNAITITSVSVPFKEGTLSSRNIVVPLGGSKSITVNLNVNKVSVDALLQTLTGSRVTATGTVSGSVPVIIKKDGTYSLGKGSLRADGGGVIQMSAEAIPGDNAQVDLVRKILENLNYSVLSASVDTSGGQGMVVRLTLEGSNPEVYDGRLVKLNVNLTGDVLDFIQQNAMLITNPEKLLQQGTP